MIWRWIALVGVVVGLGNVETRAEPRLYGGQGEARWMQALTHASPTMRSNAARALAEIGGEEAVGPLLLALADRDPDVRLHVAGAIAQLKRQPERCLPALTKLLGDEDEHVRYAAAWSLGRIADELQSSAARGERAEASGTLLAAAAVAMGEAGTQEGLRLRVQGASEAVLRAKAAGAANLAAVSSPQMPAPPNGAGQSEELPAALAKLVEELRSDDDYAQVLALSRVKDLDAELAGRLLGALAKDVDGEDWSLLQWKLPESLAELGPAIVPVLVKTLADGDAPARRLAVDVVAQLKAEAGSATAALVRLLDDEGTTEELRDQVLNALAEMGPAAKEAAPQLARLVGDEEQEEQLRISAAVALEKIGPEGRSAAAALLKVLQRKDEGTELRLAAGQALARVAPASLETAEALVLAIREAEEAELAVGLARVLATLGPEAAATFPVLVQLIQAEGIDDQQRAELIRAVGEMGPRAEAAVFTLVRLLADAERGEAVHVTAALALGNIGPGAVQAIAEELQRATPEVRLTLARALVAIGPRAEPAKEALLRLLESEQESEEVRVLAAIALGKIGSPAGIAVPALMQIIKGPATNAQLRAMCVSAIGSIDASQAALLRAMCDDPEILVQIAAAHALAKQGESGEDAVERLVNMLRDPEVLEVAERALIDIGKVAIPALGKAANDRTLPLETRLRCVELLGAIGQDSLHVLIAAVDDSELAETAADALVGLEQRNVPALLSAAEDANRYGPEARERFREVVRMMFDGFGAGGEDMTWGDAHPLATLSSDEPRETIRLGPGIAVMGKAGSAIARGAEEQPTIEADGYKTVKVFYGTNRKAVEAASGGTGWRMSLDLLLSTKTWAALALVVCLICLLWQKSRSLIALVASSLGLAVLIAPYVPVEWAFPVASVAAPLYGGELGTEVEMGVCEVTIPRIHEPGELEGPSLFLELEVDPEKHIVLQRIERRPCDAFFAEMQGELARKGKHVLVFVHGYNVSFADAARRTAQMAEDLKYPGAAVFYSWPSQANWYHYRLDERNVELSVTPLKEFLLDVAKRSEATTINLVAHSMGNRALTNALKEIDVVTGNHGKLFNQVILAAPDIDARVFRDQIAPAIVTKAEHITLYASSKDLALLASQQFNRGDARAGDAGSGLVVVPGVETIDASAGDCSLLGHCYYGSSVSVLRDIASLLQNQPAQARPFLEPVPYNGMTYWLFAPPVVAAKEADASLR